MRDYLDELLEALAEPEEEGDVPEVRETAAPVVGGTAARAGRGTPSAAPGADAPAGAERNAGRLVDFLEKALKQLETPGWTAAARTEPPDGSGGAVGQPVPTGEEAAGAVWTSGDVLGYGGASGDGGLPPSLRRQADAGHSAAALERRLAAGLAIQTAVVRPAGGLETAELSGGGLELEELDRRVERDARRYDGGMFLY